MFGGVENKIHLKLRDAEPSDDAKAPLYLPLLFFIIFSNYLTHA